MTSRQRVMNTLRGDIPDKTPVTIYCDKMPQCTVERELRNRGMCLVKRTASYSINTPNVKVESHTSTGDDGRTMVRTVYSTPYGELSTVHEPAGFTAWWHERMFKSPDDYKAIMFMIKDSVVEPAYDAAAKLVEDLGDDFVVRDCLPLEPLQTFVSGLYIGMEDFCMQWMDNQDEILKLYDAQVDLARKIYPIVADGPLEFSNYGGNVVPQIIGVENFRKYYIDNYNEAAEILHKKGKLIGTHLDGENTPIMDAVAETDLDYIEAYDPGMSPSVAEARKVWPDKTLWLNWPSSWHLKSLQEVYDGTLQMIEEAAPGNNFIIGITEDVPENRWRENFTTIMKAIDDAAGN